MIRLREEDYERAKTRLIGQERVRQGIGTLGEKTVHAVLKNGYEPCADKQEVALLGYVADIYNGEEIVEIQSRSFNVMRDKLAAFLPVCPVTIVYPVPRVKWVSWIDEETGEISPRHKSPIRGSAYQVFPELYKIKPFLREPNLRVHVLLLDMEEYRLLNGWSRDRKRGSHRYDRIPGQFGEELCFDRPEDYRMLIPYELPEPFTVKEFAAAAHIRPQLAGIVVHVLAWLALLEKKGKRGNAFLYEAVDG